MGFILKKFDSKRRKVRDKAVSLLRMAVAAAALTLVPFPMKIDAVEEHEETKQAIETESDTSPQESELLRESEQETTAEEETETAAAVAFQEETEQAKETEQEITEKEETQPVTAASTESEVLKETEQESSAKEETEAKDPAMTDASQEPELAQKAETESGNGNDEEKIPREVISDTKRAVRSEVPEAAEIKVPIYNYDVVNIVAPAKYAVALNPYELAVRTGEEEVSTEQVVSRNYGILNKSSTDKIVSVTFMVEESTLGNSIANKQERRSLRNERDTGWMIVGVEWFGKDNE